MLSYRFDNVVWKAIVDSKFFKYIENTPAIFLGGDKRQYSLIITMRHGDWIINSGEITYSYIMFIDPDKIDMVFKLLQ